MFIKVVLLSMKILIQSILILIDINIENLFYIILLINLQNSIFKVFIFLNVISLDCKRFILTS